MKRKYISFLLITSLLLQNACTVRIPMTSNPKKLHHTAEEINPYYKVNEKGKRLFWLSTVSVGIGGLGYLFSYLDKTTDRKGKYAHLTPRDIHEKSMIWAAAYGGGSLLTGAILLGDSKGTRRTIENINEQGFEKWLSSYNGKQKTNYIKYSGTYPRYIIIEKAQVPAYEAEEKRRREDAEKQRLEQERVLALKKQEEQKRREEEERKVKGAKEHGIAIALAQIYETLLEKYEMDFDLSLGDLSEAIFVVGLKNQVEELSENDPKTVFKLNRILLPAKDITYYKLSLSSLDYEFLKEEEIKDDNLHILKQRYHIKSYSEKDRRSAVIEYVDLIKEGVFKKEINEEKVQRYLFRRLYLNQQSDLTVNEFRKILESRGYTKTNNLETETMSVYRKRVAEKDLSFITKDLKAVRGEYTVTISLKPDDNVIVIGL